MAYLPAGFRKALVRLKTPPVNLTTLRKRVIAEGGKLDPKQSPFVSSQQNVERYGFALPASLVALLELGDELLIEDVAPKMTSFRYLRVAPGGWELPVEEPGTPYALTVARRFDWNTFSNMQLWEHLAGTMSLGWDNSDNRWMVSTQSEEAPVFWMDHETAVMTNAVATSLEHFLRVQVGSDDDKGVPAVERELVRKPEIWDRTEGGTDYLPAPNGTALTSWPRFLGARADWIVGCIAFGKPERLDQAEVFAFDFNKELPLARSSEPLALYWMLRAYYLGERDVFDEVAPGAQRISLLAKSFAELLEERWKAKPKTSALAKVREELAERTDLPRKAKWPKGVREQLV